MATLLDAFIMMPFQFKIIVIAGLIWLPSSFVTYTYFKKIGSLDYLLFSWWFIFNGIGFVTFPYYSWAEINKISLPWLDFIFFVFQGVTLIFQISIALRLKPELQAKKWLWYILIAFMFMVSLVAFLELLNVTLPVASWQILTFFIVYYALVWNYAFWTVSPPYPHRKVTISLWIWRYVGIIDSIVAISQVIDVFSATVDLSLIATITLWLAIPYVLVILINGTFLPHSLLITQTQILRAEILFNKVSQAQEGLMLNDVHTYIQEARAILKRDGI